VSGAVSDTPWWSARIGRILSIMLVFLAFGPPIGGLVLFIWKGLFQHGWSGLLSGSVVLGYFLGALPAAFVGLTIGTWQVLVRPVSWFVALGVGIAAGLVIGLPQDRDLSLAPDPFPQFHDLPVIMLICVVPTMSCWCIVRTWYRSPPNPVIAGASKGSSVNTIP
jgi:hypothetical protein